jgi:hypothetical protein
VITLESQAEELNQEVEIQEEETQDIEALIELEIMKKIHTRKMRIIMNHLKIKEVAEMVVEINEEMTLME